MLLTKEEKVERVLLAEELIQKVLDFKFDPDVQRFAIVGKDDFRVTFHKVKVSSSEAKRPEYKYHIALTALYWDDNYYNYKLGSYRSLKQLKENERWIIIRRLLQHLKLRKADIQNSTKLLEWFE